MGLLSGLLCTSLPDMWAKDTAARRKNNVGSSMMGHQLSAASSINFSLYGQTSNVNLIWNFAIDNVHDNLTDLYAINNIEVTDTFNRNFTGVVELSTRGGIEGTLVQND
jgi:hypothetical protein